MTSVSGIVEGMCLQASAVLVAIIGLGACGPTVEPGPDLSGPTVEPGPDLSGAGSGGAAAGGSRSTLGSDFGGSAGFAWPERATELESNPPSSSSEDRVCHGREPRNVVAFATIAEKQQALIGSWIQCSAHGIGPEDAAGLEITPDGKFAVLIREDGRLVRAVGVLHEGHVELVQNQINFVFAGNSTWQSGLMFSDEVPFRMFALNTDFIGYDYIR